MRSAGPAPSLHTTSRGMRGLRGQALVLGFCVGLIAPLAGPSDAQAQRYTLTLPEPPPSFLDRERPERVASAIGTEVAGRAQSVARAPHTAAIPLRRQAAAAVHLGIDASLQQASRYAAEEPFQAQHGRLKLPSAEPLRAAFGHRPRTRPGVFLPHPGWTFATPAGSPVHAPARGVILHAGFVDGLGGTLLIAHDRHHLSLLTHLISIDVQAGDVVGPGQRLGGGGALSAWGTEDTYFEIRIDGIPVDPAPWMERQPALRGRTTPQSTR